MQDLKLLIHHVSVIREKNEKIFQIIGANFNIFQMLGVNHYENSHSIIIGEFLNNFGSHGFNHKFLHAFIETLGEYFTINNFNYSNSRLHLEYSSEFGRIDILIVDNQNNAIIIENKIYAPDQMNQLIRYDNFARKYINKYQILYLTLDGSKATDQSANGIYYLPISYSKTIIKWLEKCVSISCRNPIVRETIIQYINHVKQLTNQDMNINNKEEIAEYFTIGDNLKTAQVIFQNYTSTFNFIAEKYFNPKMVEYALSIGMVYNYESSDESHIRFYLTKSEWQGRYWIAFLYETNKYQYGICNKPENYSMPTEKRKILIEYLKNFGVTPCRESSWWPFYSPRPNLVIDNWINDIINSDSFLNDCKSKIELLNNAITTID